MPPEEFTLRAPTRGNRRLDQLLDAVNADLQVKALVARRPASTRSGSG